MTEALFSLCTIIGVIVLLLLAMFFVFYLCDTLVEIITKKSILERIIEKSEREKRDVRKKI